MLHINKNIIASIDFSITCPAICIFDKTIELSPDNVLWFFLKSSPTKKEKNQKFRENIYPNYFEYNYINYTDRWLFIADWCISILKEYKVSHVVIEDYALSANGKVFNIAEATGLLKVFLFLNGIDYTLLPPTTIKKGFTSNGRANKDVMINHFIKTTGYDISSDLDKPNSTKSPISDIVDTYAIMDFYLKCS